jgi:hypothetical protein
MVTFVISAMVQELKMAAIRFLEARSLWQDHAGKIFGRTFGMQSLR